MATVNAFDLMTPAQVGEHVNRSEQVLARWRRENKGPPWLKFGRQIMYRRADVATWINSQVRQSDAVESA